MSVLSEEERNMLIYFWEKAEDLERWVNWDEKDLKKKNFPLWVAWKDFKAARSAMDKLIREL